MHHAGAAGALEAALALIDGVRERDNPRLTPALILLGIGTASEELLRDGAAPGRRTRRCRWR